MPPPTCPNTVWKIVLWLYCSLAKWNVTVEWNKIYIFFYLKTYIADFHRRADESLQQIGSGKALGPDGITNIDLKTDVSIDMYNACLNGVVFPGTWKIN